jgi:hypothetical protein
MAERAEMAFVHFEVQECKKVKTRAVAGKLLAERWCKDSPRSVQEGNADVKIPLGCLVHRNDNK